MAARGTETKNAIMEKILEVFPDSFMNGKELRIPGVENGERVEIKLTFTCAKENVGSGDVGNVVAAAPKTISSIFPTQEEQDNLKELMESLGI